MGQCFHLTNRKTGGSCPSSEGKKQGAHSVLLRLFPVSHLWLWGWLCFLALPHEMQWRQCKLRRAGAQRALCTLNGCLCATNLACRGGNRDLEASVAHA